MSASNYVTGVFDGEFAKAAWRGYLSNITGFGSDQLPKAQRIEAVHRVMLKAPDGFAKTQLIAAFTEKNVTAFAKTSVSVLVLGPAANNVRNILYVHTRIRQFGARHATSLIRKAQAMALHPGEPKTLATTAAACNGWYASLLFLRNGFTCDMALFKTDITLPGEVTKGGSTALSFRYPPSTGEDQVDLVKKAMQAQRARRSQRSQDFADELQKVHTHIAARTNEQFKDEIAHATAFTDNLAIRSAPIGKKRKKEKGEDEDEDEDEVQYAPPVRRSQSKNSNQSKEPVVATPVVPSAGPSAWSSAGPSRSGRSSRSSRKAEEDAIKREVDETVGRLLEEDDDGEDEDEE